MDVTRSSSSSSAKRQHQCRFFSTLFRPSASSFHHDSNRSTRAPLSASAVAPTGIFRSAASLRSLSLSPLHLSSLQRREKSREGKEFSVQHRPCTELASSRLSYFCKRRRQHTGCRRFFFFFFFYRAQSRTCERFLSLYVSLSTIPSNTRHFACSCSDTHAYNNRPPAHHQRKKKILLLFLLFSLLSSPFVFAH